jgi:UPF0271 protein
LHRTIDLNADLGEGFPDDRALLALVTSASVCCGAHAGGSDVIRDTLRAARDCGVVVGAHPGYPDREGFGRRDQEIATDEVATLVFGQLAELSRLARDLGVPIRFLKPHGALYNQAQRQEEIARGVLAAAASLDLALLGQPGTVLEKLARSAGVSYVAEGFPERRYREDGSLVPRSEPDAVMHDPAEIEAQAIRLVESGRIATLCIHGDDPCALGKARLLHLVLEKHGIETRSFVDSSTRWA